MSETLTKQTCSIRWGIYHQDREFARETGDPCLGVVIANDKQSAEIKTGLEGLSGPTGIWAHPLSNTNKQTTKTPHAITKGETLAAG